MNSSIKDKCINSWHSLYPNKKRSSNNKTNIQKLLDILIKLGYEDKVFVDSSIFVDLYIFDNIYKKNKRYITIKLDSSNNTFFLSNYMKYDSFSKPSCVYEYLSLEKVISLIVTITNQWFNI